VAGAAHDPLVAALIVDRSKGETMSVIETAANVVVALVAALHAWFLALEMFLWERPVGMRTFRLTPGRARDTRVLAANQGLYNGFLVAGLLWGLWLAPDDHGVRAFFLGCVVVAGVFGAATVNRRVFFVQALPALLGLVLLLLR
jgi:putative membrane protein